MGDDNDEDDDPKQGLPLREESRSVKGDRDKEAERTRKDRDDD